MKKYEVIIKPQGKVLQDYWDCKESNQIIIGPLGSGKTHMTCLKVVDLMQKQPKNEYGVRRSNWVAIRNTYSELHTTTIKDWVEINGHLGKMSNGGGGKPPNQVINYKMPDGTTVESTITFIALDLPKDIKKLRGMNLSGGWLNEVKELPKAVLDMLDLRVGRYNPDNIKSKYWYGIVGDSNAPDTDHWLYTLAEVEKPKGWKFFKQPGGVIKVNDQWVPNLYAENVKNLPRNYYERGMAGKSDDWIAVNLGNQYGFVSDGKPVHPGYNDQIHCVDIDFVPDENKPIIVGMDAGRDVCAVLIQETNLGGYIAFDELYTDGSTPAAEFAPLISTYLNKHYGNYEFELYIDPAGGSTNQSNNDTPIKIFQSAGLPIKPTNTNNPVIRRAAVDIPLRQMDMAGKPKLIILPKCDRLRKGLAGGFCYKRVMVAGDVRYKDVPDKGPYSHIVEAFEYGLLGGYGLGENIIKSKETTKWDDWNTEINI